MLSLVFPLATNVTVSVENSLEGGGRVPAYLQAIAAAQPDGQNAQNAVERAAKLTKTVIFGGTLPPLLKIQMGLRIADQLKATYATTHLKRLAQAVPSLSFTDRERLPLAVRYADDLTRDVHGVSNEAFAGAKTKFNDAQIVELTMVTCFFNYWTRLTMGLGVETEPWIASTRPQVPTFTETDFTSARVALASDAELEMASGILERSKSPSGNNSLGIRIANSQRAMVRVPDIQEAWSGGWSRTPNTPNPNAVSRTTMLQVSLTVSQINGCRYCTLHQVQGLRRQGVEIEKLVAMQKDDSALTKEEKAAVDFARKLTKTPGAITEADRTNLQSAFPGTKAFDILQQTCRFAFMNRFTDGLRLPSEDEAVKTYKETYGALPPDRDWKKK
jgi:AhpD family alkylhydroperoxidase